MTPPLRGRSIVYIASIDWDYLWQSHQEIASRFADAGNSVVFIDNSGVRSVGLRDARRIVDRLFRGLPGVGGGHREPYPGVQVVAPLLLPFPRSWIARAINRRILVPRLARRLSALGVRDPIVFTFLPTTNALDLIAEIRGPRSLVAYYCVADFSELTDARAELAASEGRLVRDADLIFVQGRSLVERFAPLNAHVHDVHVGINGRVFDPAKVAAPAAELATLPRPIVGYSGGLHRHIDYRLLTDVARAIPQGTLVLVGPATVSVGAVAAEPNVVFLGHRAFRDLPPLLAAFDVGIVPYVRSPYTDTVYPSKLFEYLAMGVAAVSTDLPELVRLGLPPSALRIASAGEPFVAAVLDALAHPEPEHRGLRRRLALERDWDRIVDRLATTIAERAAELHGS